MQRYPLVCLHSVRAVLLPHLASLSQAFSGEERLIAEEVGMCHRLRNAVQFLLNEQSFLQLAITKPSLNQSRAGIEVVL